MSGAAKRIFQSELNKIKSELNNPIKEILKILPKDYTLEDIKYLLEEFYYFEYFNLRDFKAYYNKQNERLIKNQKKSRYEFESINNFLLSFSTIRKAFEYSNKKKYNQNFCEEIRLINYEILKKKREEKLKKRKEKLDKAKERLQNVEPKFLDKLMGLYSRKNASQKDKMYIIIEIKKYYCEKTINFFRKINNTEYNTQLREEAFFQLQEWGHYIRLRSGKYIIVKTKNKKRKEFIKKVYKNQRTRIQLTPQELEAKIDESLFQKIKSYDYFISHSSKDFKLVQELKTHFNNLRKNIYCDWISDNHYLKRTLVSEATKVVIEKRLEQSLELIFIDTENSRNSNWVKYELNYFENLKKPIYFWDNEKKEKILMKDKWFIDKNFRNIPLY